MSLVPNNLKSYVVRGESAESLATLTGRTTIWAITLKRISKRPLFGYGYDVEGQILHDPEDNIFLKTDSYYLNHVEITPRFSLHNGYLSVLVGTGIIGFIVWLYLLFCPFHLLSQLPNAPDLANFKRSLLVMMIMGLGTNLVEYTIDGGRNLFSISFWILWTVLVKVSRDFPLSLSLVAKD